MTLNAELAHAARRSAALNAQLPAELKLDLAAEWRRLAANLSRCRSKAPANSR